jgi:GST-like protein
LEELCLRYGVEYDAFSINISKGEQFESGFVDVNPNSKIPALLHHRDNATSSGDTPQPPVRVFESAAILLYLTESFDTDCAFIPPTTEVQRRTECISWLFWIQGSAPYIGGGFGHFYTYASTKQEYPINRFAMETKRLLSVLERHLAGDSATPGGSAGGPFIMGEQYTIADMAIWPWMGNLVLGRLYSAATFLSCEEYPHVLAWAKRVDGREGVKRGRMVNRGWGGAGGALKERHSVADFEQFKAFLEGT